MGTFLAVTSVIGRSKIEVISSLANYAKSVNGGLAEESNLDSQSPNCCIVDESNGNTSVLYPDGYLEWDSSSEFISRELNATVFSFHIHDGDFWMYVLYNNGHIADQFNPVPDYWDSNLPEAEIEDWKGNAQTIASLIPYIKIVDIDQYLVRWDLDDETQIKAYPADEFTREDWQLTDFMSKLKLPYPIDEEGNPIGQTFKLWTSELKLASQQSRAEKQGSGKASKPWWRFW